MIVKQYARGRVVPSSAQDAQVSGSRRNPAGVRHRMGGLLRRAGRRMYRVAKSAMPPIQATFPFSASARTPAVLKRQASPRRMPL